MNDAALIAVIDDHASVRDAVKGLIISLGYSVVSFASADEFLSSGIENIRCVITDVQMPGMGGIELQQQLISAGHHIPMIFMAASAERKTTDPACTATKFGFLRKPFREEVLIACLTDALKASSAACPARFGGSLVGERHRV
jgi:FixJ family two-component response regulator